MMDTQTAILKSLEGQNGLSFGELYARIVDLMDEPASKSKVRREIKKLDDKVDRRQTDDSPIRYDYFLKAAPGGLIGAYTGDASSGFSAECLKCYRTETGDSHESAYAELAGSCSQSGCPWKKEENMASVREDVPSHGCASCGHEATGRALRFDRCLACGAKR
jgi:hypothetical protein